jgi:septum site-determining protein MinC
MPVVGKGNAPAIFDLKSASMTLVALVLHSADLADLAQELAKRFGETQDFFNNDPVVIDFSALEDVPSDFDFDALMGLLRSYRMQPVAVRGCSAALIQCAQSVGLADAQEDASKLQARPGQRQKVADQEASQDLVSEVERGVRQARTMVIHKPLRSGQRVYAKGSDLVVLAAVNFGAEAIADGHIHVYAPLRGKAIAGASGNTEARIFSTCMEPELVSIAGTYRTTEIPLPTDVIGKPAQIRLDGERLVFEAIP